MTLLGLAIANRVQHRTRDPNEETCSRPDQTHQLKGQKAENLCGCESVPQAEIIAFVCIVDVLSALPRRL